MPYTPGQYSGGASTTASGGYTPGMYSGGYKPGMYSQVDPDAIPPEGQIRAPYTTGEKLAQQFKGFTSAPFSTLGKAALAGAGKLMNTATLGAFEPPEETIAGGQRPTVPQLLATPLRMGTQGAEKAGGTVAETSGRLGLPAPIGAAAGLATEMLADPSNYIPVKGTAATELRPWFHPTEIAELAHIGAGVIQPLVNKGVEAGGSVLSRLAGKKPIPVTPEDAIASLPGQQEVNQKIGGLLNAYVPQAETSPLTPQEISDFQDVRARLKSGSPKLGAPEETQVPNAKTNAESLSKTAPEPSELAKQEVPQPSLFERLEAPVETKTPIEAPAPPTREHPPQEATQPQIEPSTQPMPTDLRAEPVDLDPAQVGKPVQIDPKAIGIDPERFQYKEFTSKAGTNKKLPGEWNPYAGGNILVWEDEAGKPWVVNGHHRLEKALQEGQPAINAQVIRAADGYNESQAMRLGAEINIAEGRGTIYDNARYFREAPNAGIEYSPAELKAKGLETDGYILGQRASDDLYAAFQGHTIKPEIATAIARASEDEALQRAGMKYALKNPKADPQDVENFVHAMKAQALEKGVGNFDLFGKDDSAIKETEQLSKAATSIQKEISDKINSVRGVLKRPEIAAKQGVTMKNPIQTLESVKGMKILQDRFADGKWASDPEIMDLVRQKRDFMTGAKQGALDLNTMNAEIIPGGKAATELAFNSAKKIFSGDTPSVIEGVTDQSKLVDTAALQAVRSDVDKMLDAVGLPKQGWKNLEGARQIGAVMPPQDVLPRLAPMMNRTYDAMLDTRLQYMDALKQILKPLGRGSQAKFAGRAISMVLDQQLPEQVLKNPLHMQIYQNCRAWLDKLADLEGLEKGNRLTSYFPHIIEDPALLERFKKEPTFFVDENGKWIKPLQNPFHLERKGVQGFSYDLADVLAKRGSIGIRKKFMNDLSIEMMRGVKAADPGTQKYVQLLADRLLGRPMRINNAIDSVIYNAGMDPRTASKASLFMTKAYYRSLIGFSLSTGVKEMFRVGNTFAEFGPRYMAEGMLKMFTPTQIKAFRDAGVIKNYTAMMEGPMDMMTGSKFANLYDKLAMSPVKTAMYLNRSLAWNSAMAKAATLVKNGKLAPELVDDFSKACVDKLMGRYGITNISPYVNTPLGKLIYQFSTYPTNQLVFMKQLLREPDASKIAGINVKFLRLLLFQGACITGASALGLDVKDSLGWGNVKGVPIPLPGVGLASHYANLQPVGMQLGSAIGSGLRIGFNALTGKRNSAKDIAELKGTGKTALQNLVGGSFPGAGFIPPITVGGMTFDPRLAAVKKTASYLDELQKGYASKPNGDYEYSLDPHEALAKYVGLKPKPMAEYQQAQGR